MFKRLHDWVFLCMFLWIAHCQDRWVHNCLSERREVVCEKGAIFELTGIYSAYRQLGCPRNSTDPVSIIANCSKKHRYEKVFTSTIATVCNQTSACNITAIGGGEPIVTCAEFPRVISNFLSYSYTCKPRPSTTPLPTSEGSATRMSHGSHQQTLPATHHEEMKNTDKPPDYTSVDIAAATIGGLLLGVLLGATTMLCLAVHRGVPESIVKCVKCRHRRKDGSTQSNGLQRHTNEEVRTEYYIANISGQSRVHSHSGLNTANQCQPLNAEDLNLDDVKVYSELQTNDYVNGPDSTVYEGLNPQRL